VHENDGSVQVGRFHELVSRFSAPDRQITYLLYYEKGMMSPLYAFHLNDAGDLNVGVYRP
jgi:thiamine biosynthesis protein ThiI